LSPSYWQAYDHYAYALVVGVGTVIAVVASHGFMSRSRWSGWFRSLAGVAPPFINIVGVLFGLTLAFLANDTWTAHDRAIGAVLHEADSIHTLAVLSDAFDPAAGQGFRAALVGYKEVLVAEWPRLARGDTDPAVGRQGDLLLSLAAARTLGEAAGPTLQRAMLEQVIELRASRDLRIGLSQTHVNPLKWLGMAFLGFLTLISVAVVHAADPRAALIAIILFALAAAPTCAIVLIHGNPFQPPSAVSPQPIAEALGTP